MTGRWSAVLFDFDYTLGDTERGIVASTRHALEQMGLSQPPEGEIRRTIGMTLERSFTALTGSTDPAGQAEFSRLFNEKAEEVILERAGISPAVLVSAQDAVPKPAPDGILLAARSLRLPPEQVLYIGDSLSDEAAARAAGCGFIALTTGATLPEEFAPDTELCENLIALRERLEQEGRA